MTSSLPDPARASRRRFDALLAGGIVSAALCAAIACQSLRAIQTEPVPPEASDLFDQAEAIDALAATGEDAAALRERARELAQRALDAAPNWIAPVRLLDDLLRAELRGVEALAAHRERLAARGEDASELYLAGRLEGIDGEARFARAAELDPNLAWARHGLAASAERRGDLRAAVAHARAAAARARDPWERSFFASSLARLLARSASRKEALEVLAARLAAPDITAQDKIYLSVQAAGIALDDRDAANSVAAFRRAVDLVRDPALPDGEVETLAAKIRLLAGREEGALLELSNALASKRSPVRDQLRAELMLASGSTPLALGLLERSLADEGRLQPSGPLLRAARFSAGDFGLAVERWLQDLPTHVRDANGLPRDERLARVVRCERAVADAPPSADRAAAWFDLGEALLDAGWFREARALAGSLARVDFDRSLALESRAAAGLQLLDSLDDLIRGADSRGAHRLAATRADREASGEGGGRAPSVRGPAVEPRDLDELLASMGPVFARFGAQFAATGERPARELRDAEALSRELSASPRLDYGIAGEVVHPGPAFTAADERDGLGKAGEPVPGLAQEMASIHRFALLGQLSGSGGPDGTVLPRVMTEDKRGEHLGVPWSGSVAWCEGADVKSRAERNGARISAAALHEGYWMDIDSVRGERSLYAALRAAFAGPDGAQRVEQALAVGGFRLESSGDADRERRERRRTGSALGESSRVRLAVLRDRAKPGESILGDVSLDEFATVTGTHEEGHLTDRTRYLPISKHWGAALRFLAQCGFSPTKVAERLEYRAELVAICDSPDPRVPLAQVLDAADGGGIGPTAHAAGYEALLEDLLRVLDDALQKDPASFRSIDPGRTLVHQLHRLAPEEVRRLARELASDRGLVRT
jgi:hypothetical protein